MKTVRINRNDYELNWVTGNVLETSKNMETKVSGGGGSYSSYQGTGRGHVNPIVSTTTVHDQIFITDNGGQEHSYQLQNIDVACRAGNKLSVIWAIKNGQQSGPYVAVINHSTSDSFINEPTLYKMYHPINETLLGILAVIVIILLGISLALSQLVVFLALFVSFIFYMRKRTKGNVQKFRAYLQPEEFN